MIKVIETSTAERKQETIELFNEIKPYLDDGYSYTSALEKVGRITSKAKGYYYCQAWFKDLKEYGESQGYYYTDYSGKGLK